MSTEHKNVTFLYMKCLADDPKVPFQLMNPIII